MPIDGGTDAPAWVKLLSVVGAVVCLAGFALFMYTVYTESQNLNQPPSPGFASGYVQGGVIFFSGLALLAIAAIGRSFSK